MKKKKETPFLRRTLAYDDQYLSPEGLYALNRMLDEIQDKLQNDPGMAEESLVITPTLFNKKSRTFQFACVLGQGWGPRKICDRQFEEGFLRRAVSCLCDITHDENILNAAVSNLQNGATYDGAAASVRAYRNILLSGEQEQGDHACSFDDDTRNPEITNEHVRKLGLLCAQSDDSNGSEVLKRQRDLIRTLHLFYHGVKTHRDLYLAGILHRGLVHYSKRDGVGYFMGNPVEDDKKGDPNVYAGSYYDLSGNYINESKGRYNQSEVTYEGDCNSTVVSVEKYWSERGGDAFYKLASLFYIEELDASDSRKKWWRAGPVLLLPIYDIWLGGEGFGGVWGCLVCTFKNRWKRRRFVRKTLPRFLPRCEALADELFKSGLAKISDEMIRPPYDLVEHFVKTITHIQDWERVSVYRGEDTGGKLLYCYRRKLTKEDDLSSGYAWELCDRKDCRACDEEKNRKSDRILSWDKSKLNIWRSELIPELTGEDIDAYKDIILEFEYPETAYVPGEPTTDEDATRAHFKNAVILQQIETLRFLIPKIRAHRYALRTASAAIIGRNLSHNVGSHVLARMSGSAELRKTLKALRPPAPTIADVFANPLSQLIGYVRERMDYIAEVATGEPSWSVPDHLEKVLKKFSDQRILSSTLTERKCELTRAEQSDRKGDTPVTFPHCRMGMQALFSILENSLRNSVRHGNDGTGKGKMEWWIKDGSGDGIAELVLADRGCVKKMGTDDPVEKIRNGLKGGFYVKEGEQGAVVLSREAWGLKEMKISGAFLRKRPPYMADGYDDPEGSPGYDKTRDMPWIEPCWVKLPNGRDNHEYLGWLVRLLKPKRFAVVGEVLGADLRTTLSDNGIDIFSSIESIKTAKVGHPFLVVKQDDWCRIQGDKPLRRGLPQRIILVANADLENLEFPVIGEEQWKRIWGRTKIEPEAFDTDVALYESWNLWLSTKAGVSHLPMLVIAHPVGLAASEERDDVIVVREGGPSRKGTCAIFQSEDKGCGRLIIYERHPCRRLISQEDLWKRAQMHVGYTGGDDIKTVAESAIHKPDPGADNSTSKLICNKLTEAGLVWVLVLDERLSEWVKSLRNPGWSDDNLHEHAGEERWTEVTPWKLYRSGILVFQFENEEEIKCSELKLANLKKFLSGDGEGWRAGFPGEPGMLFVTIHHGILKDIFKEDWKLACEWVQGVEKDLAPGVPTEVVIHSGRGVPPELRQDLLGPVKFVEFSNIIEWVKRPAFKPYLVNLFMSLRRTEGL